MSMFSRTVLLVALGYSAVGWADSAATQLDCYKIKDEERQEYRAEWNSFRGIYVSRLTIRSRDNEITWATPKSSKKSSDGEFLEIENVFKIVDDTLADRLLKREHWIKAVDLSNKAFIALNRRDGKLVHVRMPWSSINDGPYAYRFEGMEAQCEVVNNLF